MSDCGEELPVHWSGERDGCRFRGMILYGTAIASERLDLVTCPRCLAILARPAAENPCVQIGED